MEVASSFVLARAVQIMVVGGGCFVLRPRNDGCRAALAMTFVLCLGIVPGQGFSQISADLFRRSAQIFMSSVSAGICVFDLRRSARTKIMALLFIYISSKQRTKPLA